MLCSVNIYLVLTLLQALKKYLNENQPTNQPDLVLFLVEVFFLPYHWDTPFFLD